MALLAASSLALGLFSALTNAQNVAYTNPILPGWHSDPSCVFAAELENTTFCTTSSFLAFPGNPIYASQDLVNWKLASNALSRVEQLPEIRTATNQQFAGMFANTLRFHKGRFYLISAWINTDIPNPRFVLNTATDPFDDASWGDLMLIEPSSRTIDPDIFFEDDGSIVVASSGTPIIASHLDITTGKLSEPWNMWNGTGGDSIEGPHLYKKDGYYYLLIAEGGTQLGHSAIVARSKNLINGTWEASPSNPLVSNRGTNEYFQTVGHADLFEDERGNWWGVALSTRGGPTLYNQSIFPMGRETVLYPVSWPTGEFPIAQQVRGEMSGPLPLRQQNGDSDSRAASPLVGHSETVDFERGSSLPKTWLFWRAPFNSSCFQVSPKHHPNTLQLTSSRVNLTGDATFNASVEGLVAVFRRQEHTFFNYTVNLHLGFGKAAGDELGVSNFLNQDQHVDLGIVYLATATTNGSSSSSDLTPHLRFRTHSVRAKMPREIVTEVPRDWCGGGGEDAAAIRVRVSSVSESVYGFHVAPAGRLEEEVLYTEYNTALLAGDGAGSGGLLGVYATTNGGRGHVFEGLVSEWRYGPVGQKVDYGVTVAVRG
ncbi:xylosidase : arabinofuranosidase [Pyrenophora seminiperda CCB06]|uniref:Xylosidase: arabinofuranosidase n=1 Tax=Pyrenophora seminiperda CCB06 TaxID=1302712 RepID=A0A3M7MFD6_9PLEO|nr:xylosidase : arabinofuranosidase [Pyrenophora seminiperda CCB06]